MVEIRAAVVFLAFLMTLAAKGKRIQISSVSEVTELWNLDQKFFVLIQNNMVKN